MLLIHRSTLLTSLFATTLLAAAPSIASAAPAMPFGKKAPTASRGTASEGMRACASDRHAGKDVVSRDHRGGRSEACALADAQHNLAIAKKQLAGATDAAEREKRKLAVEGWQLVVDRLELPELRRQLDEARGPARAELERKIDGKIANVERAADRLSQQVRDKAVSYQERAKDRVGELERQLASATGEAKQELEVKKAKAERALVGIQRKIGELDLENAQRKLDYAKQRVGAEAAKLRKQAEQELGRAKQKLEALKQQLDEALARIDQKLEELAQLAREIQEQAEQALSDVEDAIDDLGQYL